MNTFKRLLRHALTRIWSINHHAPLPDDVDIVLVALAHEYLANDRAIHALLERDGRDTDDIPDFAPLADRQAELVELIAGTPARRSAGLLAKARCARVRPAERGFDAALELSLSLADDLLHGSDSPAPSSPSHRLMSSPDTSYTQLEEQNMNKMSDVDRLVICRRNDFWRHASGTCTMIGAVAVVALIALPANSVGLTWLAMAALLATGVAAIGLGFFLLRFINYSA